MALAIDSSGNLYVANDSGSTVSKFAPGATTPTATLTGLTSPDALAFDASGNLYVANDANTGTVSEFTPGATTPTATFTGLSRPAGSGLRLQRQPLRGQLRHRYGEQVRSGERRCSHGRRRGHPLVAADSADEHRRHQ